MVEAAKLRHPEAYNHMSFMQGAGNVTGFLGEAIVQHNYPDWKHVDTSMCDFIANGNRIEVKSKKHGKAEPPLPYYEASVTVQSLHQSYLADIYVFTRIYETHGWIMGWMPVKEFKEKARFLRAGIRDGDNDYIVRNSCYNVRYDQLNPVNAYGPLTQMVRVPDS